MTLGKQIGFSIFLGLLVTMFSIQLWHLAPPCGSPGSPQPGSGEQPCIALGKAGWPVSLYPHATPGTEDYSAFALDVLFWSATIFTLIRISSALKRRV